MGGWAVLLLTIYAGGTATARAESPYARWSRGPSHQEDFFPIAVWTQNPAKADRYRAAGFNLYVGLWRGPTEEHLELLRQAGMPVICHQNAVGLAHKDDPIIVGWMHGDEPDNAQSLGEGKGYGPPIAPEKIVADYQRIQAADPNRPVVLNLGQGVAWDGWHGRGVRTNHPEDYPHYVQGCDIASFDIYPVTHPRPEVSGKLWYVAHGVERLTQWTRDGQIVWNCIECTRINDPRHKPTPHQVRCEVWMSIIHGSMGLIYFVHEWEPKFDESAILSDPGMYASLARINRQIAELAPVLNSPTARDGATVACENADIPVAFMVKRHNGATYVFAVCMRDGRTRAQFTVRDLKGDSAVDVLGESRTIACADGTFADEFKPWEVHLYRIDEGHAD